VRDSPNGLARPTLASGTMAPMPHRALPELYLADLKPGDLILSRAKLCIPGGWESALIVLLDGGDYSHGAMFNGEAFVEMISAGIVASPPRVKTHVHRYSHVYRFHDPDGADLGKHLPAAPVIDAANGYLNTINRYGYTELIMVAIILVLRGAFASPWQRACFEVLAGIVLSLLKRLIDKWRDERAVTMTCTQFVSQSYWDAHHATAEPYGLRIRIRDRHRDRRAQRLSGLLGRLHAELTRLDPALGRSLTAQIEMRHDTMPEELIAGSPQLPANCVSPCDLQRSPSLTLLGRYVEGLAEGLAD